MPKVYIDKDVYTAAIERFEYVFTHFDNYYFSVSGGKDSSVMLQLAASVARRLHKKISVMYVDFEAQYQMTIDHIQTLIQEVSDVLERWYWICLPMSLRNAVSVIQPKWVCWNKAEEDIWVREMPDNVWVVNEDNMPEEWTWFKFGMEFEQFILFFGDWFNKTHGGITACGIGIRSDESLNRFRTITNYSKVKYKDIHWTTRVKIRNNDTDVYNFYPMYDWKTTDIWTAISKFDLKFNQIYEQLYKNGVPLSEQRLCQPYGDDQRKSLDQFRALEYETWERVLRRVHGVNFGNIYCRTSVLGMIKTEKPEGMSWQEYTVFLLESLGLYVPELRDHYYYKIKAFFTWYETKKGIPVSEIRDEEPKSLENSKKIASWRRVARALEHNDFWMKRLSFSQNQHDVRKLFELQKKYRNLKLIDEDVDDKDLRDLQTVIMGER